MTKTVKQLQAENAQLLDALEQCYATMGWRRVLVPAHVANDTRSAILAAGGDVERRVERVVS